MFNIIKKRKNFKKTLSKLLNFWQITKKKYNNKIENIFYQKLRSSLTFINCPLMQKMKIENTELEEFQNKKYKKYE